jgi:hypothetical protein
MIRTLFNPVQGVFGNFNPNHFCSSAADGSPYLSMHTLYEYKRDRLWVGHIFRDFPGEDWQIQLRGSDEVRGAWSNFEIAHAQLLQWAQEKKLADEQLRKEWNLGEKSRH